MFMWIVWCILCLFLIVSVWVVSGIVVVEKLLFRMKIVKKNCEVSMMVVSLVVFSWLMMRMFVVLIVSCVICVLISGVLSNVVFVRCWFQELFVFNVCFIMIFWCFILVVGQESIKSILVVIICLGIQFKKVVNGILEKYCVDEIF